MAYQPNQNPTWAERDSLDPNDSRRIIKGADFGAEFNSIKTELDSIKTEVDSISSGIGNIEHGNVASCYYNHEAGIGSAGLVYAYNVTDVIVDPIANSQTRIVFDQSLPNFDDAGSAHFSFNLTPISSTGYPCVVTVTQAEAQYISFMAWQVVDNEFQLFPAQTMSFSFMVIDMDKAQ